MAKELSQQQIQLCQSIVRNIGVIEAFGKSIETDLQDNVLSGSEKIELLLQSAILPGAVLGIIADRRVFKKENQGTETLMLVKIGELIGGDEVAAQSRVALSFDFASKMIGRVAVILDETRDYVRALRGEVIQPAIRTRKPGTPKA